MKRVGFLDLPGEVRNQIYGYHFANGFRVVLTPKSPPKNQKEIKFTFIRVSSTTKQTTKLPKEPVPTLRISRTLFKTRHDALPLYEGNTFFSLMFACKQVHKETCPMFYEATVFRFETMRGFRSFLKGVPPQNLSAIKKLELSHHSYGEPHHPQFIPYKQRYDKVWHELCRSASQMLTGLKSLTLDLHIRECPLQFELYEPWVQPLLEFRRLNHVPVTPVLRKQPQKQSPSSDREHRSKKCTVSSTKQLNLSTPLNELQLTKIKIRITSGAERAHLTQDIHPGIISAYEYQRERFADAIKYMILGWDQKNAMAEYFHTYRTKHFRWRHFLNLNDVEDVEDDRD